MPAEWEPHEATWIAWPHERTDWPGKFEAIPWIYGEIVRRLARVERVRILVQDEELRESSRAVLEQCGVPLHQVDYFVTQTDRSWTRDFCPIFVQRPGGIAVTNWMFNGWAKYDNWAADNAVPPFVAQSLGVPQFDPGIVLEGGSGANVGFRVEPYAHHRKDLADDAHHDGVQVLLAQAVIAGIAFHAFVALDGGALNHRVDVNRLHRANVSAVTAGDAFLRVNPHMADCGE